MFVQIQSSESGDQLYSVCVIILHDNFVSEKNEKSKRHKGDTKVRKERDGISKEKDEVDQDKDKDGENDKERE